VGMVDDLALVLSSIADEDPDILSVSWPWGIMGLEEPADFICRAQTYCRATELAFSEGFTDLAVALLTFFIATQSAASGGVLHVPLERLVPLIERALGTSNRKSLVRGLQIARDCADKARRPIEVLVISGFLREHTDRPQNIVPFVQPKSKTTVEITLIEQIGADAKSILSNEAWNLLLQAELMWERLYMDYGMRSMNWGAIAVAYVQPLEAELSRRLEGVFKSKDYRVYLDSKGTKVGFAPTLGPLLYMLKEFVHLPKTTRKRIQEAHIRLQDDPKFLETLINKVVRLRNQAAHPEEFSESDFLELKTFLLRDGGYKQFVMLLN
jgi:hypothetical protein